MMMGTTMLRKFAMLGFFLTLAITTANAQSGSRLSVNIPFDFTSGKSSMPAG
jgi:hypothetical protein